MSRTRVKICGITRKQDLHDVASAGADAIGLVFYERSPRHVDLDLAAELSRTAPAFLTTVALFKDADEAYIREVLERVDIDLIQFHGSETPEFCRGFDRPYIKALGMLGDVDIGSEADRFQDARGILLDAHAPGADGGTGDTFDWNRIPPALSQRLILAGGLDPENVFAAVRLTRPYAVDVSSGVEESRGIKSTERVRRFIQEVSRADSE